jgi:hypothetical protein
MKTLMSSFGAYARERRIEAFGAGENACRRRRLPAAFAAIKKL